MTTQARLIPPLMRQAIGVLPLSTRELQDLVRHELGENPRRQEVASEAAPEATV